MKRLGLRQIRTLNDRLRQTGSGGTIQITAGLAALGPDLVFKVLAAVAGFDRFTADNDPWGEHDCALLTVDDQTILWKIDYYDQTRSCLSPDPADPTLTAQGPDRHAGQRVLRGRGDGHQHRRGGQADPGPPQP